MKFDCCHRPVWPPTPGDLALAGTPYGPQVRTPILHCAASASAKLTSGTVQSSKHNSNSIAKLSPQKCFPRSTHQSVEKTAIHQSVQPTSLQFVQPSSRQFYSRPDVAMCPIGDATVSFVHPSLLISAATPSPPSSPPYSTPA